MRTKAVDEWSDFCLPESQEARRESVRGCNASNEVSPVAKNSNTAAGVDDIEVSAFNGHRLTHQGRARDNHRPGRIGDGCGGNGGRIFVKGQGASVESVYGKKISWA